ncbi:MAG: hypothetical protein ACOYZ8_12720 [Chloroflexota bacterium]
MQLISPAFKKLTSLKWMPFLLAVLGGTVYVVHAYTIAHDHASYLDEGLYLYKGLLFFTGQYQLFEDYGLWTNHPPLAFLIPGAIQTWFGPGLDVGRYFMIALALLSLAGLWILVRRWGGTWWAAGAVWVMALNPAEVKALTLAITQGIIVCMFVWSLVFLLGEKRAAWQVMLGAALAALLPLTRINLAPVMPIILLYVFWQYGWRTGLLATLAGVLVLVVGYAPYWPNFLKIWAGWLPASLTPFLDPWRVPLEARGLSDAPNEPRTLYTVFLYFWMTLRLHFVSLGSALIVWLLWPSRAPSPLTPRLRAAILLSVLLIVLLAAHMAVSFLKTYCVSCILLYVVFFDFLGLVLLAVAFPFLKRATSILRRRFILLLILVVIFGVGFSAYEDVNADFAKSILDQIKDGRAWGTLTHFITGVSNLLLFRRLFTLLTSFLFAVGFFLLLAGLRKRLPTEQRGPRTASLALTLLLILGFLLTPTLVLGKGNDFFACGDTDVIATYERAGEHLRSIVPPGSTVYWDGRIDAIFLYLPGVTVYPPQLHHVHSYLIGGDADALLRFGLWNDELARQWINEADYVLIEKGWQQDWEMQTLEAGGYVKLESTRKVEACRWQSIIDIYQRVETP